MDTIRQLVDTELLNAKSKWPRIRGAHEGASLIQEELEEFREAIRKDQSMMNTDAADELVQIAAMAIRTLEDVYNNGEPLGGIPLHRRMFY